MNPQKSAKFFYLIILSLLLTMGCRSPVECTQFTEEDANWAGDQASPDLHHLNASFSEIPFEFSSDDLQELITKNSFSISEGQDEVLFALRGCQITNSKQGEFSDSVQLQETTPNHKEYKDVFGVWRQSSDDLAVFEGSTVPNWYYMCIQAEMGGHQANMLPTGRYLYQVGHHRDIEGVFRSEQEVIVLRSNDDLTFETTDLWEIWVPVDNIHPGGCADKMYSSAGCQTIPGTFGTGCEGDYPEEKETHLGIWGDFRTSAGLDPENNQDRWEETYIYILLTCREARLVSQEDESESLLRLRFGSTGDNVLHLQQALLDMGYDPGSLDGIMGPKTTAALIAWQQSEFEGQADGILTPSLADLLGFELE